MLTHAEALMLCKALLELGWLGLPDLHSDGKRWRVIVVSGPRREAVQCATS